jgi:hypothetical protein
MKINWSEIYEGWRNALIPPEHLKQLIQQVSCERMEICCECEFNSKNTKKKSIRPDEHCMECGCTLSAKTKCLSCNCPLEFPKWEAVITQQQEDEIESGK